MISAMWMQIITVMLASALTPTEMGKLVQKLTGVPVYPPVCRIGDDNCSGFFEWTQMSW